MCSKYYQLLTTLCSLLVCLAHYSCLLTTHPSVFTACTTYYLLLGACYSPLTPHLLLTSYYLHAATDFCFVSHRHRTPHTSHIVHLISYIVPIVHLTSYILHLTSYILHLTSYILHPTSYILHLTSYTLPIVHLTSYTSYNPHLAPHLV